MVRCEEESILSSYQRIGTLNEAHNIELVQNIQTNGIYVRKTLTIYSHAVYQELMEHHIRDIPTVYAAVEDGDRLIVIEEYVHGITLQETLEQRSYTETEAAELVVALCRIIHDLHSCIPPIIHRDIKPENILITEDGTVKLLDLNAAKQYSAYKGGDT